MLADLIWDQMKTDVFITKEQFLKGLEGWDLQPILSHGDVVGATWVKGCEFHFSAFRSKWVTNRHIHEALKPLLKKHGRIEIDVAKDNPRIRKFAERIGFREVGESEFFTRLTLKELRHA